ncbi:MAG: transcriptional repressor NrdR [Parasporobacterium sp.]|nr:transcriptional repressor NrdR [Parasporobacterium sp.]
MKCPYCGCVDTKVLDSRPNDDRTAIRRRRECERCEKRFTTYEKIETIPLIVIKKDNNREAYDRTKIEGGVLRACYKRPVSAARLEQLIDDIENDIFALGTAEVKSTDIGEIVMERIKDVDQVAYVRFASVYREFKDVNTFIDEIKKLTT